MERDGVTTRSGGVTTRRQHLPALPAGPASAPTVLRLVVERDGVTTREQHLQVLSAGPATAPTVPRLVIERERVRETVSPLRGSTFYRRVLLSD